MYTFTEIHDFDLDDYMPHIGWIGDRYIQLYSKEKTDNYFLYDRESDRLFEYSMNGEKLNSKEAYERVVIDLKASPFSS